MDEKNVDLDQILFLLLEELNRVRNYTDDSGAKSLMDDDDFLEAVKMVVSILGKEKLLALGLTENELVKEANKI